MNSSKRKSDNIKPIPIKEAGNQDPPEWNDVLRGILIALVEQRRAMWDARFRPAKERCLQLCTEIAGILSNQDKRMNEWAVLEKWCWMMEMYVRAVEMEGSTWRYQSAMSFISGFAGNGGQYLACVPRKRFLELTDLYAAQPEEATIAAAPLPPKCVKVAAAWFLHELMEYSVMQIARGSSSTPTSIVPKLSGLSSPVNLVAVPVSIGDQPQNVAEVLNSLLHKSAPPPRRGRPPRASKAAVRTSPNGNDENIPRPTSSCIPTTEIVTLMDAGRLSNASSSAATIKEEVLDAGSTPNEVDFSGGQSGRPRIYANNADKMRAYRERRRELEQTHKKNSYNGAHSLRHDVEHECTSADHWMEAESEGSTADLVWTPALVTHLISEVKARPILWHVKHPQYHEQERRKELFYGVASALRQYHGAERITVLDVAQKWTELLQKFEAETKNDPNAGKSDFSRHLNFLLPSSPNHNAKTAIKKENEIAGNGFLVDPAIFTNGQFQNAEEVISQMKSLMGLTASFTSPMSPNGEPSPKRARNSPTQELQKTPQITATWIPPKEDSFLTKSLSGPSVSTPFAAISSSVATVATVAPTATAQIVSTSNGTLSSLLESVKPTGKRRQNQANLIAEQLMRCAEQKGERAAPSTSSRPEDKWNLLGRLIEETCRELEQKNPPLAVLLQKDLSDIICSYQMKTLNLPIS